MAAKIELDVDLPGRFPVKRGSFRVTGRVTSDDTDEGIHGLRIRALARGPWWRLGPVFGMTRRHEVVATVLTRRDGGFTLEWPGSTIAQLFTRQTVVLLDVSDRDTNLIHTADKATTIQRGKTPSLPLRLAAQQLANHRSRPTTLATTGGPLLPRGVLKSIGLALELLAPRGTPEYLELLGLAYCPLPLIDGYEDLLDDAWGVLNDDFDARQRFRDVLDLAGGPDRTDSAMSQAERPHHVARRAGALSAVEDLVGREAFLPVVLAGELVAGDKPHERDRYVEVALDQLSAYFPIAALHTAATMALSGGPIEQARLQAVMLGLRGWCADGLPVPPGIPDIPGPSIPDLPSIEHMGCTADLDAALEILRRRVPDPSRPAPTEYVIESITPGRACAGETITIHGRGFMGTVRPGFTGTGLVRFAGPGSGDTRATHIDVAPVSWTDTTITVVAPADAHCGPLSLRIVHDVLTVMVCDAFVDLSTYRTPAAPTVFSGCKPRIRRFSINDGQMCVPRDMPARLSWSVHPPDAIVTILERIDGTVRPLVSGTGPNGVENLDTSAMGLRDLWINVTNPHASCGSESNSARPLRLEVGAPAPTLAIVGVELTQGIQRFSLQEPAAPENNSVELIANMDTVVRVFVQCARGGFSGDMAQISGMLTMIRGSTGGTYRPMNGVPLGSAPIITAKPNPSRNATDDSLNFLIPAADSHGDGTLLIQIVSAELCENYVSVSTVQEIGWTERPAYPVTIRRIADPDGSVLTVAQALKVLDEVFEMLPSPLTEIRLRPGVFSIGEISAEANYCHGGGLLQLADSLAYEHNGVEGYWPDPHESAWIGLLFREDCEFGGMMAWPWTSTCVSQRGAAVAAHELAHTTGMGHTQTSAGERCNDAGQPVACHSLPNNGQLTDVAFLPRTNLAVAGASDLMSYQLGSRYLHPFHWELVREKMNTRF